MRLTILSSLALTLLALGTGCSASSHQTAQHAATPVSVSSDPAYNPPDEWRMSTSDVKASQPKSDLVAAMPAPNKRQIVTHALH